MFRASTEFLIMVHEGKDMLEDQK